MQKSTALVGKNPTGQAGPYCMKSKGLSSQVMEHNFIKLYSHLISGSLLEFGAVYCSTWLLSNIQRKKLRIRHSKSVNFYREKSFLPKGQWYN